MQNQILTVGKCYEISFNKPNVTKVVCCQFIHCDSYFLIEENTIYPNRKSDVGAYYFSKYIKISRHDDWYNLYDSTIRELDEIETELFKSKLYTYIKE